MERLSDKWAVLLIVVLMAALTTSISVAGYNFIYKNAEKNIKAMEDVKKAKVEEETQNVEKKKVRKKKVKDSSFKSAYKRVLEANAGAIKGYNWQQSSGGVKNVSIVDINGDGVKELFFMSRDAGEAGNAHLNIYTFKNGNARQLSYSMSNIDRAGKVTADGKGLSDFNAASGVRYIVYLNKSNSNLGIYKVFGDTYQDKYLEEYSFRDALVSTRHLFNHYSDMDSTDEYFINKSKVSSAEGQKAFEAAKGSVGAIIMACDSAWKNVSTAGNMAMTYNQAIQALS